MSVVTISRGTFSGGKMVAECVSKHLGFRCIDRDVIVERAAVHGISQDDLRDALDKPPTFMDRFRHTKYLYLTLIQAALAEEVRTGCVVYHGNAGHLLLKDASPVLRTRIIAPLEFRLTMCRDRLKLSRSEALAYIQKVDQHRRKWTQYLYGVDWRDPSLYDIVVNLEYIGINEACEIVAAMVRQPCYELTAERRASLEGLALASRVKASLALNEPTTDLEVEVSAEHGIVHIKGKLTSPEQVKQVERVAGAVPGVTDLKLDVLAPTSYA